MRAKASIPAWAKLLAISAAAVVVIALLVAAPWRSEEGEACAELRENVGLVQSGAERRRVSRGLVFAETRRFGISARMTDGDFSPPPTIDEVRTCLGPDWTETHVAAQAQAYGDAWVFSRPGAPLVMYVQSRTERYGRVEMKIIVERAD
jgi:hypothetical protein